MTPLAAPLLGPVGGGGGPLQIPGVAEGKDALLLLNKVLDVDLVLHLFNGGFPIVAVFIPNLDELGLEDLLHLVPVRQQAGVVGNALFQLPVLGQQLIPLQTLEPFQLHVQNGLGLNVVQAEPGHEIFLGVIVAAAG